MKDALIFALREPIFGVVAACFPWFSRVPAPPAYVAAVMLGCRWSNTEPESAVVEGFKLNTLPGAPLSATSILTRYVTSQGRAGPRIID